MPQGKGVPRSSAGRAAAAAQSNPQAVPSTAGITNAGKPRVTVEQCRLLSRLWPYAKQYEHNHLRSQIISDIFDGHFNLCEVKPLVTGGLAVEVHCYDPSAEIKRYSTWDLTPLGELAVFGAQRVPQ
jgi:hypothetical protein